MTEPLRTPPPHTHEDETEGYSGPATMLVDEVEHSVELTVTGHFEPISGKYTWYGRVRGLTEVTNDIEVLLRTPEAEARASVTEKDLWGNHLIRGIDAPPFPAFDASALD